MLDTCQTHQTPGPNCKSMRPTKENVLRKTVSTPSRQNNLRLREQTLTSLIQRYLRLRQQTLTSFSQTGTRQEEASPNGGNPHPPQQLWCRCAHKSRRPPQRKLRECQQCKRHPWTTSPRSSRRPLSSHCRLYRPDQPQDALQLERVCSQIPLCIFHDVITFCFGLKLAARTRIA